MHSVIDLHEIPLSDIVHELKKRGYDVDLNPEPATPSQILLCRAKDSELVSYIKRLGYSVTNPNSPVMEVATDQMKLDDGVWSV